MEASFNLDFTILEQNGNQEGRVTWELSGPDVNSSAISGDVTGETINGTSGLQAATLGSPGVYTLTITAAVPDQSFDSNRSASADLDGLTSFVVSIPEPSALILLSIGVMAIIWRRS